MQQQLEAIREARRNKILPSTSTASSSSSSSACSTNNATYKCEKRLDILNQQLHKKQQQQTEDANAVKEFLIDGPLHFSVLELSAKNQLLLQKQQLQQQLGGGGTQQQQQQQQSQTGSSTGNDAGGNGGGGGGGGTGVCLPFTLTLDEQKRKVDAGYVSLKDTYTACSSVYGVGTSTIINDACKSTGNGTEIFPGNDLRPAKIGRMMVTAAIAASQGAKTATVSWRGRKGLWSWCS